MADFDVYKSLWSSINDICAPPPPPNDVPPACFLMEMPGFSVDPDAYDPEKFTDPGSMMSPDCATAMLCDRIPALGQYFYDTGNHISFFWELLINTYGITTPPEDSAELKERYDEAITMLYGSQEGYVKQEKTELFKNVDVLREVWHKKSDKLTQYKHKCQADTKNWPGNYQNGAKVFTEARDGAYNEYNILKMQIKTSESAMFAYATGDLRTVMMDQRIKMSTHQMNDAGKTEQTFYQTTMEPANWYNWFRPTKAGEKPDDEGWTEVEIKQEHKYEASHDTYSKVAVEAAASYGGLFYSGSVSGGYSRSTGNSSLTAKGSNVKISFKVRKVLIQRPWLEPVVLQYSTLGIRQLDKAKWSTGVIDKNNKGTFPLLPTAFVVAKDVVISADSFSDEATKAFGKEADHASAKVGIGCFSASGSYSHETGSTDSTHTYDAGSKTLKIHGAQIIGWVCAVIPEFPMAEM